MKTTTITLVWMAMLSSVAGSAAAQAPITETGPTLPPALRQHVPGPSPSGAALQTQAMQKLKIRFEQADANASGGLTKDEASKAGFGFVVTHFDEIDTQKRGSVTFEELAQFMRERRR